jgi:XTP/dITP diphosphohydrolase
MRDKRVAANEPTEIVAASQNEHKIAELSAILEEYGYVVVSRSAVGASDFDVDEDGDSFEANSLKKALATMRATGKPAVADDSGLETDFLSGAPGVYSARFAGVVGKTADYENNRKLLRLLEGAPNEKRKGRFVSVVTLVFPDGSVFSARGECEGSIGTEARGAGGFGYDPLFTPEGYKETFAQLPASVKNRISHRAKALGKLKEMLEGAEALKVPPVSR